LSDKLSTFDNESFGLTDEEYQFLLDDIDQAIEEGNKIYGYGYGNDKPKRSRPRPKSKGPSVEEVAIARGLIKFHRPTITIKK
jgi:hypothetical protein